MATPAFAQTPRIGGGPIQIGPLDHNTEINAIYRAASARARSLGLLPRSRALPSPILQYPLRLRPNASAAGGEAIFNFVDLDPTSGVKDFTCGSRTYDGHKGTDIGLFPYWWVMMDRQEVEIVAAAPGNIIGKDDGHFDRQCSLGSGQKANYVIIRQDDGVDALYWHMKKGSVTSRPVGSRVTAGDYLGLVGSSGYSTGPHLHLEFRTAASATIDPYAGKCGDKKTSWRHQPEDFHTAILRVVTQKTQPAPYSGTCGQNLSPKYADQFKLGSTVWVAAYIRDQRTNTPLQLTILRPDGTTLFSYTYSAPSTVYPALYYYYGFDLPTTRTARGEWKVQVKLDGETVEHVFVVGRLPKRTTLRTHVRPLEATAAPKDPARFRVVVRNSGASEAVGCSVAADAPLAANVKFKARGSKANAAFDIAAGARQVVQLVIKPKRRYRARAAEVPIRVFCDNAFAPKSREGVNIVTLSF